MLLHTHTQGCKKAARCSRQAGAAHPMTPALTPSEVGALCAGCFCAAAGQLAGRQAGRRSAHGGASGHRQHCAAQRCPRCLRGAVRCSCAGRTGAGTGTAPPSHPEAGRQSRLSAGNVAHGQAKAAFLSSPGKASRRLGWHQPYLESCTCRGGCAHDQGWGPGAWSSGAAGQPVTQTRVLGCVHADRRDVGAHCVLSKHARVDSRRRGKAELLSAPLTRMCRPCCRWVRPPCQRRMAGRWRCSSGTRSSGRSKWKGEATQFWTWPLP